MSSASGVMTQPLSLIDELVLTLLNEESGYFRQVPGWNLNCAVVGAALAELSLMARIDTDMESLILLDASATGDPALDPVLSRIASEADQRNAQYWVERLAPQAESIIDMTLDRLCRLRILQHHDGDFWSLAGSAWRMGVHAGSEVGTAVEHVKTRISRAIFDNEIPDPRDVIIVCLIDTCDVLRFIFELDEEAEQRVQDISRMDLIGRAIADAVGQNIAGAQFRRSALAKKIPVVPLRRVLRSRHVRTGNLPALFADLHGEFGPVFEIRPPLAQDMICLVGPEANHWVHRHGRMHLRARDYLEDFEKVYGGVGLLPALDGADHFRYRKSIQPAYSRARLEERLDELLSYARTEMSDWNVGGTRPAVGMCRKLVNSAMSPLTVGIDSQDVVDDMHKFKDRALKTHIGRTLPKFMLKTPPMRRRAKLVGAVVDRVLSGHTPAQRIGCPRDLADDLLTMHTNDRQFLPESNLPFVLSAPLIASMYVGDQLSFIVYAMVSQPEFHDRIRAEADAVFAGGDPDRETLTGPATDVTRRFIMECMRLYPIVPLSVRNVMNACEVEGYELPEGRRVFIVQTATHYMDSLFADPSKFDIDRYEAPRKEHVGTAYAPYGLGTHNCLGARLTELYLATNLLLVAHHFELEIAPKNYKLKISPFPSMSPSKKLKFRIAEQRHELPA
ncbi:MAG: cytochrome P450 [Acidimicrobiaceae bacterium]|nr:cytochrome P450 [Acidimicrobiaceae bacterium]MYE97363.1 cytochrome P450 [Acidimicrobiaceae bacterium]MYI53481.1 cytochrome P450 [Acidimicrobiaceae bacterium]